MNIEKEINDSVWTPVLHLVETPVLDLGWDSVSGSVWGSVWGSVRGSVFDSVSESLRNTVVIPIKEYEY
jgi:hypothetical protein